MEVSGVALRPSPCFSGAGFDTQSSKLSFPCSNLPTNGGELRVSNHGLRSKNYEVSSLGFSDSGHVQYYVSPKAGLKEKEKKQRKNSEAKALKKKLKLVKGMSKDLLRFSSMGLGLRLDVEDGLIGDVKGKSISEATEILLAQLQQLKVEEKELKRRKKEEKAKLNMESSSSSSESSDSEGGEVVDMTSLRGAAITVPSVEAISEAIEDRINLNAEASTSCRNENSEMLAGSAGMIEICMGGKCKKSGAPALLDEFQQRVGIEGAVAGCKCMGKCRDGPNVRIVNQGNGDVARPLCVGVGLEDVDVIVSNFFSGERKELELMVA